MISELGVVTMGHLLRWYRQYCSYYLQVTILSFVSSIVIGFSSICYVNMIDQLLTFLIGEDDKFEFFSGGLIIQSKLCG